VIAVEVEVGVDADVRMVRIIAIRITIVIVLAVIFISMLSMTNTTNIIITMTNTIAHNAMTHGVQKTVAIHTQRLVIHIAQRRVPMLRYPTLRIQPFPYAAVAAFQKRQAKRTRRRST